MDGGVITAIHSLAMKMSQKWINFQYKSRVRLSAHSLGATDSWKDGILTRQELTRSLKNVVDDTKEAEKKLHEMLARFSKS